MDNTTARVKNEGQIGTTHVNKVVLNNNGGKPAGDALDMLESFHDHLVHRQLLPREKSGFNIAEARKSGKPLQKLQQLTELSAHDFADEVARFFGWPRIALPELMRAPSLADRFSPR